MASQCILTSKCIYGLSDFRWAFLASHTSIIVAGIVEENKRWFVGSNGKCIRWLINKTLFTSNLKSEVFPRRLWAPEGNYLAPRLCKLKKKSIGNQLYSSVIDRRHAQSQGPESWFTFFCTFAIHFCRFLFIRCFSSTEPRKLLVSSSRAVPKVLNFCLLKSMNSLIRFSFDFFLFLSGIWGIAPLNRWLALNEWLPLSSAKNQIQNNYE